MINVQRGFRDKLEKYVNLNQSLSVEMQVNGRAIYDYCCFGVDAANQLSDDRYMVFYNQTRSPAGEVTYTNNGGIARFEIRLSQLPDTIRKLVFTVSIDGNGTMGDIVSHTLRIGQNGQNAVEMQLSGKDFHSEKAIISIEIYRKDVWRFAAVASGFNGGLGDLLRSYGGEEAEAAPTPSPVSSTPKPAHNQTSAQNMFTTQQRPNNTSVSAPANVNPLLSPLNHLSSSTKPTKPANASAPSGSVNPMLSPLPTMNTPPTPANASAPSGSVDPMLSPLPTANTSPTAPTAGYPVGGGTYPAAPPQNNAGNYTVMQSASINSQAPVPPPTAAVPAKKQKKGFFSWLGGKNKQEEQSATAMPPAGGYPSAMPTQAGGYPSTTPTQAGGYPSTIPTQAGGYPSTTPIQAGGYPSTTPTQAGGYPSTIPTQAGGYPSTTPTQAGGYPSTTPTQAGGYPSTTPTQAGGYSSTTPTQAGGYPSTTPTQAGGYPSAMPTPSTGKKVSLEKKLQSGAPHLVSLAKPLELQLEKHHLQDCVARVGLVLDISGSMSSRYRDGTVQDIVNKTLPLAVQFDDDGELDCWYYGSRFKRMPSVNMQNYTSAVPSDWEDLMSNLGYGNDEPKVMQDVIKEYKSGRLPAYVLFITDGGVGSAGQIKKLMKEASYYPIFWQFVGVGGSSYGVLEKLDTMDDRYVDNANFFALDDFKTVSNSELYDRLLKEFPLWLNEIRRKGMI